MRLSDPGELAAGLPSLIGFRPQESLVLVTLAGVTGGRVGMTVRVDLPPPEHAGVVAAALADAVSREEPAAALLAVVSEAADEPSVFGTPAVDLPHRGLLRQVVLALGAQGTAVRESLLVRRGRWWSYECPHACCDAGSKSSASTSTATHCMITSSASTTRKLLFLRTSTPSIPVIGPALIRTRSPMTR